MSPFSKEEVRSTKDEGQIVPSTNKLSTSQLANFRIRVRILDFGLAGEIRSSMSRVSTETGDTSGTRPYMAPEQWLGEKQDGRADQYALACVLYELLSGAPDSWYCKMRGQTMRKSWNHKGKIDVESCRSS